MGLASSKVGLVEVEQRFGCDWAFPETPMLLGCGPAAAVPQPKLLLFLVSPGPGAWNLLI
jgi:hypothetical protein